MAIEIVSCPLNSMMIFHNYVMFTRGLPLSTIGSWFCETTWSNRKPNGTYNKWNDYVIIANQSFFAINLTLSYISIQTHRLIRHTFYLSKLSGQKSHDGIVWRISSHWSSKMDGWEKRAILKCWVNYYNSLTLIKAIWGWFPLLTVIYGEVVVRSL